MLFDAQFKLIRRSFDCIPSISNFKLLRVGIINYLVLLNFLLESVKRRERNESSRIIGKRKTINVNRKKSVISFKRKI